MNFGDFEVEIKKFFDENFNNLKRTKVSNSERAFTELLLTEHADTNNAIRSVMKKVIMAARAEFVKLTDELKGYELGEQFKKSVKVPQLEMIKVDFNRESAKDTKGTVNQTYKNTQSAADKFKQGSPVNQEKKNNAAQMAGIAAAGTIVVGTPLLTALTPLGIGTSLVIAGISAIVIGSIVYIIFNVQDESGNVQQVKMQQSTTRPGATNTTSAQPVKKTMDKASVDLMLDARRAEAELAVENAIQQAEIEYKKIIAQLNA
ncbi:hypothetical protein [Caryophanon latum]|uniref:Uncharacterized protein n=1 Tax=Caryophanon latum TaxID=33977 RepID=A0A1C0YZC0_9BACL|nr:hypothetical protein [Caryophanon latum]OCS92491.1 hypothetical protein A6K76_06290 [Caryophanon latum]